MEFNKNYLVKQTENGFEEGDIVSFKEVEKGVRIWQNGHVLPGVYETVPELTVVPLSENDINKKVITKAVAWGMKVFGDFAGLNEFNSVARIANINKRKVR
mgnify:CR=1 FL=1